MYATSELMAPLQIDLAVGRVEEDVVAMEHGVLRRRRVRVIVTCDIGNPDPPCALPCTLLARMSVLFDVRTSMPFSGEPETSLPKR